MRRLPSQRQRPIRAPTPASTETTTAEASLDASSALNGEHVHARWQERYRSELNRRFFEAALAEVFAPLRSDAQKLRVLDAGCGTGTKTELLAGMGFSVLGVDTSEDALAAARENSKRCPYVDRLSYARQDISALDLDAASIDAVLCWGVLMHVEDVAAVVRELARVTRPGGMAVVSEANCRSLQSRLVCAVRTLGRIDPRPERDPLGLRFRKRTTQGELLIRHMDVPRLVSLLADHGFALRSRRAGQLTEFYALFSNPLIVGTLHRLNGFWYANVGHPGAAFGNILVLERTNALN